jgi:hypothetical protein
MPALVTTITPANALLSKRSDCRPHKRVVLSDTAAGRPRGGGPLRSVRFRLVRG